MTHTVKLYYAHVQKKFKEKVKMNIILLSGGSGKRLWPLSNDIRSKQFIKLFKDEMVSMNQWYSVCIVRLLKLIMMQMLR